MNTYSIVFSNYTFQLFAWKGVKKDLKKYLANREIIGTVKAEDEASALDAWRQRGISNV